jgi:hypothetical protein
VAPIRSLCVHDGLSIEPSHTSAGIFEAEGIVGGKARAL